MAMTTRSMTRKARKVTCTKFETTDKKTPKSLLDLPPELREHVYRYLFKGSRITFKECTYSTYTRTNVELALTLTNKTIRLESLPCLYQSTQLLFDRTEVSYRINELIPKGFLASVKHVSCYVSQLCGMQINAKVFPSLVKLDVYIGDLHHDYQEDYEKAIETEMNRIYVDKAFEILAMPVYEGLAEGMGIANEARSYEITMTIKINLLRFFDGSRKGYGAAMTVDMDKRKVFNELRYHKYHNDFEKGWDDGLDDYDDFYMNQEPATDDEDDEEDAENSEEEWSEGEGSSNEDRRE